MNFSLKPNPLIAIWLPGTALLIIIILTCPQIYDEKFIQYLKGHRSLNIASISIILFIISIFGFIIGELLDCIRDIFEEIIEKILKTSNKDSWRIGWNFFVNADKDKIANLEEWYYTYYELDSNIFIGILLLFLLQIFSFIYIPCTWNITLLIISLILIIDIIFMRKEIAKHTEEYIKND
jgi:succinate-acetate transporter protein